MTRMIILFIMEKEIEIARILKVKRKKLAVEMNREEIKSDQGKGERKRERKRIRKIKNKEREKKEKQKGEREKNRINSEEIN